MFSTLPAEPFFHLGELEKTMHESSKVFVEHARVVARNRPNNPSLAIVGSIMTMRVLE